MISTWDLVWATNSQESRPDDESSGHAFQFSPFRLQNNWIPSPHKSRLAKFKALSHRIQWNTGCKIKSTMTGSLPGIYVIEFEIPIYARLPVTVDHEDLKVSYYIRAACSHNSTASESTSASKEVTVIQAPPLMPLLDQTPNLCTRRWNDGTKIEISVERHSAPLNGSCPVGISAKSRKGIRTLDVMICLSEVVGKPSRFESQFDNHRLTAVLCHTAERFQCYIKASETKDLAVKNSTQVAESPQMVNSGTPIKFSEKNPEKTPNQVPGIAEMKLDVSLPKCATHEVTKSIDSMNFDIRQGKLQISHTLKIVVDVLVSVENDGLKHKTFTNEVPFQLLPCEVKDSNMFLPKYTPQ